MIHCIVAQDVPTNGGAPPDLVGPIGPPVDTPLVFSARPCHFQKKQHYVFFPLSVSAFRFSFPFPAFPYTRGNRGPVPPRVAR